MSYLYFQEKGNTFKSVFGASTQWTCIYLFLLKSNCYV